MKKHRRERHFLTTALFFVLILSLSIAYITNTFVGVHDTVGDRCYDGSVIGKNDPVHRINRTVFQGRALLDSIKKYEYHLFGIVNHDNVIAGKNDFLFRVEDLQTGYHYLKDYTGALSFSDEESASILTGLRRRKELYGNRGAIYLPVFLPNAQTVHSELMPSYMGDISKHTRLSRLTDYLRRNGFADFIDMTGTLIAAKGEDVLYNNTENSLNTLGLYYTYLTVCGFFSEGAFDPGDLINLNELEFYRHLTTGKDIAVEADLEDVVKNHTVSLSNDTLLSYRVLFNSGYAAKTVRLDFSGISPDSPSLLLQFTRVSDRLSIEPFFSNTFDFVTYQPDLEDNPSLFQTASPDLVIQFIYEDELSLLLQ
ncbi:MAG: hypothetical protein E7663_03930 [Ruminococcaceae bacterium]|nr:hypothetical protein [Oscillospiraceae bacterium]